MDILSIYGERISVDENDGVITVKVHAGCHFVMIGKAGGDGSWEVDFPEGFRLKCPHGEELKLNFAGGYVIEPPSSNAALA